MDIHLQTFMVEYKEFGKVNVTFILILNAINK